MKLDDLIIHALNALKGVSQNEKLTSKNVAIAYVGRDLPFTVLEDDGVKPYVDKLVQDDIDDKKKSAIDELDEEDASKDADDDKQRDEMDQ